MKMRTCLGLFTTVLVFLTPAARAQGIMAVNENGRRVFVNDGAAVSPAARAGQVVVQQSTKSDTDSGYLYWSSVERRWKAVPRANSADMRAARSAISDVRRALAAMPPKAVDGAHACVGSCGKAVSNVTRTLTADASLDDVITEAAARHHVDVNLVRAVIKVESNFNPRAISSKGAVGLMQLMPATARQFAVKNPFDPRQNVDAGVRHLKSLLDQYSGNVPLSLAAYNAGQKAVQRSGGIPPFTETRNYVRRITALYAGSGSMAFTSPMRTFRSSDGVLNASNVE